MPPSRGQGFKCSHCAKKFKDQEHLESHVLRRHADVAPNDAVEAQNDANVTQNNTSVAQNVADVTPIGTEVTKDGVNEEVAQVARDGAALEQNGVEVTKEVQTDGVKMDKSGEVTIGNDEANPEGPENSVNNGKSILGTPGEDVDVALSSVGVESRNVDAASNFVDVELKSSELASTEEVPPKHVEGESAITKKIGDDDKSGGKEDDDGRDEAEAVQSNKLSNSSKVLLIEVEYLIYALHSFIMTSYPSA